MSESGVAARIGLRAGTGVIKVITLLAPLPLHAGTGVIKVITLLAPLPLLRAALGQAK